MTYYSPTHPPTHTLTAAAASASDISSRNLGFSEGAWGSSSADPIINNITFWTYYIVLSSTNVLPTHCIVPYIHTSFIFPFDFPQSSSSIVAPATITFCLSGGTPAMFCVTLYHCILITSPDQILQQGLRLNHSLCLSMNVVLHDHTTTYLIGTNRFN